MEKKMLEWAKTNVAQVLGITRDSVNEDVLDNVLSFTDAVELAEFLKAFSNREDAPIVATRFARELMAKKSALTTTVREKSVDQKKASKGTGKTRSSVSKAISETIVCKCLARDHPFKRNCCECGRIICERGSDSCPFCGSNNVDVENNAEFTKALTQVETLLQYDKDAARRMQVWDMETDFYAESHNPWLTQSVRDKADTLAKQEEHNQKYGHRKILNLTIDIENRVIRTDDVQMHFEQQREKELSEFLSVDAVKGSDISLPNRSRLAAMGEEIYNGVISQSNPTSNQHVSESIDNPWGPALVQKKETVIVAQSKFQADIELIPADEAFLRDSHTDGLGDKSGGGNETFDEEDDELYQSIFPDSGEMGVCLSMHQPWASLLVYGFKRLEGRNWNPEYRGRLWIHAASAVPDRTVIDSLSSHYSHLYNGVHPPFPTVWPTSALLGCVDCIDTVREQDIHTYLDDKKIQCISRHEENDSDWLLVCKAPRRLCVPIKMTGDHKLWLLPKNSLSTFQSALRPVSWPPLKHQAQRPRPLPTLLETTHRKVNINTRASIEVLSKEIFLLSKAIEGVDPLTDLLKRDAPPGDTLTGIVVDYGKRFDMAQWVNVDATGNQCRPIPSCLQNMYCEIRKLVESCQDIGYTVSIGGPHTPMLEASEFIVIDQAEEAAGLFRGTSSPTIIVCMSGGGVMLSVKGVDFAFTPGDCVWINGDAQMMSVCEGAYCVLRCNVWKG